MGKVWTEEKEIQLSPLQIALDHDELFVTMICLLGLFLIGLSLHPCLETGHDPWLQQNVCLLTKYLLEICIEFFIGLPNIITFGNFLKGPVWKSRHLDALYMCTDSSVPSHVIHLEWLCFIVFFFISEQLT